ncbi:hypothetical protein FGG08_001249 [Glutinoglossum americanum]|uniref:Uncharacterized protein n=1 Tax=Glutinoglossum americanum TaxID=1670608 RepID=A0A9P8IBF0_9PEZI|nr:hypothetical protein FGG08_001249 [Glutinoglossum americanum]
MFTDIFLQKVPEPGSLKPVSINTPQPSPGSSSLYVPPSPLLGRPPPLSPETEKELREACAEILKNFKPSGYEFMFQPQPAPRRVCIRAPIHKPADKEKPGPEPQTPLVKKRPSGIFPMFRRGSTASEAVGVSQGPAYQHVPSNAATSFAKTTTVRKPSVSGRRASSDQSNDARTLARANSNVARQVGRNTSRARPRTASGALDSNSNSSSTTRSTTTWDRTDASRSTSATTVGSHSHSPTEEYASPPEGKHSVSDNSGADAAAAVWMARELSKRRSETERPPSRSSRVLNYLRPRPSMESIRGLQVEDPSPGITWWTGNAAPKSPEPRTSNPPESVDLNRALPPLPSLSTWNSNTTAQSHTPPSLGPGGKGGKGVHIAQLMRGSSSVKKPSVTVVDQMGVERVISRSEEKQREKDLRRLVEEKMKGGSIVSPAVSPKLVKARQKSAKAEEQQRRKEDATRLRPRPATASGIYPIEKQPEADGGSREKKMNGLRRQLSKLSLGGMFVGRQRNAGRNAYGKMIEEESMRYNEKAAIRV